MPAPDADGSRSTADAAVPSLRRSDDGQWRTAARELLDADRLALLTDFDGTLAPIRNDPDAAAIRDDARAALASLAAAPATDVGVVSGRALADVRERVGLDGIVYAGDHGFVVDGPEERYVHPAAEAVQPVLADATDELRGRLADVDGAFVEAKDVTATVHYRQVDGDAAVERVRDTVAAVADDREELRVTDGKQIRELRPAVDWDKGRAVSWILDAVHADPERVPAVYLGDDVTDEAAFAALGDAGTGIAVGDGVDGTAADYRLPDVAAVADLLAWLAAERADD